MVILQSLISTFLPLNPKIISGHGHTDIYVDSWDSNSDPQVCTEDSFTLSTVSSILLVTLNSPLNRVS